MSKREGGSVQDPGGPGIPGGPVRKDPNNPTRLGGDPLNPQPFVDERVSDPHAIKYAQGADARRRGAPPIPRYFEPVAGGPDLPIPRLDGEATGGQPMAEQARAQRGLPAPNMGPLIPREPALNRGASIVEGDTHLQPPSAPARSAGLGTPPPGLHPGDLLPEQATKDPAFRQGQGSMFAANQPNLAAKYGVMRGGEFYPPGRMRAAQPQPRGAAPSKGGVLQQETLEGLKALEEFQQRREQAEGGDIDQRVMEEARQGPAGGVGATERTLTETDKKQLLDDMDDFDLHRVKSALFKDLLNNEEQKKIIEDRLPALDLGDLIINGRVTQLVPVVPGIFEPEFQSYSAGEDLTIKQLIHAEAVSLNPSDRYLLDKLTLMGLTISVKAINKRQFADYRGADGNFNEELFWKKYDIISRFNYHMIASLMVNWFWFDMRVRKLFKAETLGNG